MKDDTETSNVPTIIAIVVIMIASCLCTYIFGLEHGRSTATERATVCELALTHAPTASDTLRVYFKYEYCFDLEQEKAQNGRP